MATGILRFSICPRPGNHRKPFKDAEEDPPILGMRARPVGELQDAPAKKSMRLKVPQLLIGSGIGNHRWENDAATRPSALSRRPAEVTRA
jgi:hypothetical protein